MLVCRHINETRTPISNPPNSAQLGGTPYHSSKIRVLPLVWAFGRGQSHRQTDARDQYTFRVVYDSREM